MHTIVLGKFGAGKSRYGTQLLVDELLHTERPVVTTLAIDLPRINEYIQQLDPEHDHHVWQRVLAINKHQVAKFWRYRGVASLGEYGQVPIEYGPCSMHDKQVPFDPAWQAVSQGVCYLIDEAPFAFHARRYATTGIEFSDYIGQHRHLNDEIYSFARASDMLDKQFRITADRCIVMDNWYQKAISIFTAPKILRGDIYENCPPTPGESPVNTFKIHIDPKGLASCYNTAGGLGIAGTGTADMGKRAKGIPWWTIIPGGIAAGLLVWFGCSRLLHAGANWGSKKITVTAVQTNAAHLAASVMPGFGNITPSNAPYKPFRLTPDPQPIAPAPLPARPLPADPSVIAAKCRGFAFVNGKLWIAAEHSTFAPTNWTTRGNAILADGVLWSRDDASLPVALAAPLTRAR